MPPRGGEPRVGPVEVLANRQTVQQRHPDDVSEIVQGRPQRVVAAAIVPGHRELRMSERAHDREQLPGSDSFGVRLMMGGPRGLSDRP